MRISESLRRAKGGKGTGTYKKPGSQGLPSPKHYGRPLWKGGHQPEPISEQISKADIKKAKKLLAELEKLIDHVEDEQGTQIFHKDLYWIGKNLDGLE